MSASTKTNNKLLPALHHALSGSAGTLISTCATYPLSLVVTRLQVQRQLARSGQLDPADEYAGIVDAFSRILRDGDANADGVASRNIAALYTGLATDAAKSVLDSFLFFLFYEWFRSKRAHVRGARGKGGMGVLEELAVGVAAGACSRALTTPIANVVTRKQTSTLMENHADPSQPLSIREIAQTIMREKGVRGFWSGYSASLVLTLNPSITFFLQEFLKKSLLGAGSDDADPSPHITFLLAAVSKAVASTITYPFQIAKTRLQAGVPVETEEKTDAKDSSDTQPATTKSRDVDREVEKKLNAVRAVQEFARQSIFGTIGQIVRKEGVGSLYDGVQGELMKGFFSHGTTMLAKGVVHKLLFRLYLVLVGLLNELQSRRQQRQRAGSRPDGVEDVGMSYDPRSMASVVLARLSSSISKIRQRNGGQDHSVPSPSNILNLNDRSQRGFGSKF